MKLESVDCICSSLVATYFLAISKVKNLHPAFAATYSHDNMVAQNDTTQTSIQSIQNVHFMMPAMQHIAAGGYACMMAQRL